MSTNEARTETILVEGVSAGRKRSIFAVGSVIGAILAMSCCVMPLLFVTLGISGAWIGNLTALEPYKPYFPPASTVPTAPGRNRQPLPKPSSGSRR